MPKLAYRMAFTGICDTSLNYIVHRIEEEHGTVPVESFNRATADAAKKLCHSLSFAYDRDPELLELLRQWALRRDPHVLITRVLTAIPQHGNMVVTDMRLSYEASVMRSLQFVLVNITDDALSHSIPIAEFDYQIVRCGTDEHLFWQLDTLLRLVREGEHAKHPRRTLTIK